MCSKIDAGRWIPTTTAVLSFLVLFLPARISLKSRCSLFLSLGDSPTENLFQTLCLLAHNIEFSCRPESPTPEPSDGSADGPCSHQRRTQAVNCNDLLDGFPSLRHDSRGLRGLLQPHVIRFNSSISCFYKFHDFVLIYKIIVNAGKCWACCKVFKRQIKFNFIVIAYQIF